MLSFEFGDIHLLLETVDAASPFDEEVKVLFDLILDDS
jgi:AAA+ ATPase superfamily predicted ATPase